MTMMPEPTLYLKSRPRTEPRSGVRPLPAPVPEERKPLRVLVVEDEPDTANSMQMLLELLGYEAGVAYSGSAALPAARNFHPDVILCDLALPGMDGYAVAEAFRQEPRLAGIHMIAVSGYPPEAEPCRRSTRFERHLVKPVALDELQTVLLACRRSPVSLVESTPPCKGEP